MADITLTVVEEQPIGLTYVEAAIKPEQVKSVTPSYEAQTVLPDDGMTLGRVNVAAIPDPTDEVTITENGDYNVKRIGTAHVDVQPTLDTETVTPTEQTQTVTAGQGYDGLSEVTVNPIPSQYVVPSGSVEITQNGETSVAGKATAIVNVPGIVPSGTKEISITQNGTTTHDVTQYASAEIVTNVNTDPEKGLVFGDYDSDGYPHTARFVGTWTEIPQSMFQYTFRKDSNFKKIETLNLPVGLRTIKQWGLNNCSALKEINIPSTVQTIGNGAFGYNTDVTRFDIPIGATIDAYSFAYCSNLVSVYFLGNINEIPQNAFQNSNKIELYDFSHCTAIPPLYSVASLGHKNGCVIKIPAALSDTTLGVGNGWESATNWVNLTNIVWEVV